MSIFDVNQFIDSTTTEAGQKRDLIPIGTDVIGTIQDIKGKTATGKKDPSQTYTFFDFPIEINLKEDHPDLFEKIQVDKINLKYSAGLDITENGAMDWSKGKNTGLRILREATGTNVAGQPWSPRMLVGRRVRVKIKHREYPEQSGNLIEDIAAVAKA